MSSPAVDTVPALKTGCSMSSLRELCLALWMEAHDLARLDATVTRRQRVRAGRHLYRTRDPFLSLYAIGAGIFKTYKIDNAGHERVNGFHMIGEVMGLDAISGDNHTCNAIALDDCDECFIPFAQLEDLLQEFPSLMRQFHRLMSREIAADHVMMMLLGTMNAEQKLAVFVANLSQRLSVRGLSSTVFRLSMSREDIGNYLGLKRETVSRTMSKMQDDGLLQVEHRNLTIVNPGALQRLTGCASSTSSPG